MIDVTRIDISLSRCEIEIRSRTTVLKVHLELNEELLLQSLQTSCDEIKDKLHKISLGKHRQGQDDGDDEAVNFDLGFSSNTKHDADQGRGGGAVRGLQQAVRSAHHQQPSHRPCHGQPGEASGGVGFLPV